MTYRCQLFFFLGCWRNLIDERCYIEDEEVMAAKLAMFSFFSLCDENPGIASKKSHRVEIRLLLPQQGKKK